MGFFISITPFFIFELRLNNKLDKIIGELMHENIKSTLDTE